MLATLFVLAASAVFIITTVVLTPESRRGVNDNVDRVVGEPGNEQSEYEKSLFAEITSAWMSKCEGWFIMDYVVQAEVCNW